MIEIEISRLPRMYLYLSKYPFAQDGKWGGERERRQASRRQEASDLVRPDSSSEE
jgi:hypothetical protein